MSSCRNSFTMGSRLLGTLGKREMAYPLGTRPVLPVNTTLMAVQKSLPTPRGYSTPSGATASTEPSPHRRRRRRRLLFYTLIVGGTILYLSGANSSSAPETLNDTTFVPYTITSRTALSPASFVLTVAPHTPNPDPPYFLPGSNRWRHPLWSVEFKQPEVQISRHYTPLPPPLLPPPPPSSSSDGPDAQEAPGEADGVLSFYIRAVGDGEMSRYLSRLRPGNDVHLRGPHVGFDLVRRLGAAKRIVFLAGGTGIVPGMQAARITLDGYEDTRVNLLWAVRQRGEIQAERGPGRPWWDLRTGGGPAELDPATAGLTPVAHQLAEMKKRYGDRLSVQVVVDDEGAAFSRHHVQKALCGTPEGEAMANPGTGCALHDQRMHERASEFESSSPNCRCRAVADALPGKNLFIVSGPDGFVTRYAGAKVWAGGLHTQGPVGGIAGEVQKQNPHLARDWLVLKL